MKTTLDEPKHICENCKHYKYWYKFCEIHPEYGELVEEDTCNDWEEDEQV